MQAYLHIATRAARQAAKLLMRHWERTDTLDAIEKQPNDWVSEVDKQAEKLIIDSLQQAYPDHAILGEEFGTNQKTSDYQWIIDPLDGTQNYLRGLPHFAISIALIYQSQLACGIIYDPVRDELFTASRGHGARLNDHRLRIRADTQLHQALVGTGLPFRNPSLLPRYLKGFARVAHSVCDIRRTGSAALDLAYVASGRLDGFWEYQLQPWDIAAGALLVLEAGGFVSDIDGADSFLATGNILATSPKLFPDLQALIQQAAK